jgi:hypothetical protein
VEVLQAEKNLRRDDFDEGTWNPLFLVALDEGQKVLAKRFKNDADVKVLGTGMCERIEE